MITDKQIQAAFAVLLLVLVGFVAFNNSQPVIIENKVIMPELEMSTDAISGQGWAEWAGRVTVSNTSNVSIESGYLIRGEICMFYLNMTPGGNQTVFLLGDYNRSILVKEVNGTSTWNSTAGDNDIRIFDRLTVVSENYSSSTTTGQVLFFRFMYGDVC